MGTLVELVESQWESLLESFGCLSLMPIMCLDFKNIVKNITNIVWDKSSQNLAKYLFCKSEGEHCWNKEKCFLFHFKSSFCSWDFCSSNLNSSNIQMAWCHQMPKCDQRTSFRPILILKESSVKRIWGVLHADLIKFW